MVASRKPRSANTSPAASSNRWRVSRERAEGGVMRIAGPHAARARSPADVGRTAITGSRRGDFHSAPRTRAKVVAARGPIRRDPMATARGLPMATAPPRSSLHGTKVIYDLLSNGHLKYAFD